jgi:hydroxymethylglutaryl-CoA reductase
MATSGERSSRISGFHNLTIPDRIGKLCENGFLTPDSAAALRGEGLKVADASNMVENVVSTFGMPMGIALNIVVNGRDYAVPMVVEEPSVVAAVGNVARLTRPEGFVADSDPPVMIGQIQILDTKDISAAAKSLQTAIPSLSEQANAMHPNLIRRGGGIRGMEVRKLVYDEPGEAR